MHQKNDFISIGAVIKAHGISGEILIIPFTDELEQFNSIDKVFLNLNARRKIYAVKKVRLTDNKIILKLEGIDDRTTAQSLKGALIERKLADLRKLSDNEYFIFDLIGLEVKDVAGEYLGELTDVLTLPANDVYIIKSGEKELLIPAIKEVIKHIDLNRREMIINPIDGLLE